MKQHLTLLTIIIISACLFSNCSRHHRYRIHDNNLDLTVSESGYVYKLKADYNEDKTGDVQRYINQSIEPNGLFSSSEDYFDINTELKDHTRFSIKSSPGKLEIKLNKRENSYASYKRIKEMCEGVAGVLKEK